MVGHISELIEELNDFLYDFEGYVEADRFDKNRYSELYALSRKAAPRILHIVTRMKLESPPSQSITTSSATGNTLLFSDLPLPYPEGPEADGQIYDALRHVAKLDNAPVFPRLPYPEDEDVPHPLVPTTWSRTCQMPEQGIYQVQSEHSLSATSGQIGVSFPPVPRRSPARRPDTQVKSGMGTQPDSAAMTARYSGTEGALTDSPYLYTRGSLGSSTVVSSQTPVSDCNRCRDSYNNTVSPVSALDDDLISSEIPGQSLQISPLFSRSDAKPSILPVGSSYGLSIYAQDVPDGLIPVEDETTERGPPAPVRTPPPIPESCSITLDSPFYRLKGLCKGSMEILQGVLGVRRTKKQMDPVLTPRDVQLHAHIAPGPFRTVQGDR